MSPYQYIELRNLSKTYFSPSGDVPALKSLNVRIHQGTFVGVVGKSGAGKSTLVNILAGIDRMTEGELWIGGLPIHSLNQEKITRWRGKNLGVVFQSFELLNQISILDNILLPMDFCGIYSRLQSPAEVMKILDQLEIADHAKKSPSAISGGQRQRVAIARALVNDPQLIIADEPTGSLDTKTGEIIFNIFRSIVSSGKTVIMVTHDKTLARLFDHILVLESGVITHQYRRREKV
jgi:putative ABC transport system ATP-binding protein